MMVYDNTICPLCDKQMEEHAGLCTNALFVRREVRRCTKKKGHAGVCMFRGLPVNGRLSEGERVMVTHATSHHRSRGARA